MSSDCRTSRRLDSKPETASFTALPGSSAGVVGDDGVSLGVGVSVTVTVGLGDGVVGSGVFDGSCAVCDTDGVLDGVGVVPLPSSGPCMAYQMPAAARAAARSRSHTQARDPRRCGSSQSRSYAGSLQVSSGGSGRGETAVGAMAAGAAGSTSVRAGARCARSRLGDLATRLRSVDRVLGEERGDQRGEVGGRVGAKVTDVGRHVVGVLHEDRHRRRRREWRCAGEERREDAAEGVEVGAGVDPLARGLLGREVLGGADDRVGHRRAVLAQGLVDEAG